MDEPIFIYDKEKAPIIGYQGETPLYATLDGVPTRDLTMADWDKLSFPWKRAVAAAPFYVRTNNVSEALFTNEEAQLMPDLPPAPKGKRGKE